MLVKIVKVEKRGSKEEKLKEGKFKCSMSFLQDTWSQFIDKIIPQKNHIKVC